MGCNKLLTFAFQNFSRRKFHGTAKTTSNWRNLIRKELESRSPIESDSVCIYRIPTNIIQAEPKAFIPNNISTGPYHCGASHLQNKQMLKKKFFHRLFDPNGVNRAKLDDAFKALEGLEDKARACYQDGVKLSSDEFLQMMLVDCSFIIQLFRDSSSMKEFKQNPHLSRWMLPVIRRELMMLENQIPMFVLSKLFELTENSPTPGQPHISLKALAVPFFVRSRTNLACQKAEEFEGEHLLDLHRCSIQPKLDGKESRRTQKHMIRSVTELKEAGVKIKAAKNGQLLDIKFGKKWGIFMRELTIPTLSINDHRGTVFRNILAFEKCHKRCNPDVTAYMFFFNRLINTTDDVAHLHYKGVLNHSLGNDEKMAKLINNITREIVPDMDESYLHKIVNQANKYYGTTYARSRASIVHYYLRSWTVGISTIGALLALYFTFIQTICGFADVFKELESRSFSSIFKHALLWPFLDTVSSAIFHKDSKK